jgi:hypothetical protein
MNTKALLLAVLGLFAVVTVPAARAGNHDKFLAELTNAVGPLSAAQKKKIEAIRSTADSRVLALSAGSRRSLGAEIRVSAMDQIRGTLTPAQRAKYDEKRAAAAANKAAGQAAAAANKAAGQAGTAANQL